ncbi:MAG: sigma-70 family RNA polymerase sigma factor [Anaerolineales bacterium]|jgi:RNA polymerase sigma-70 factor (ECF subfamily)
MPTTHNPEEAVWIARAQDGDDMAFANLVDAYQAPIFNLCYRILGDTAAAEDAAQESFLKAYRHLRRYDPERKFANWILTIASNYCVDMLRRRRISTLPLESAPLQSPLIQAPEAVIIDAETSGRLQALIKELDPVDRAAIVLHYWYDMPLGEIGRSLKLTRSAVKSRMFRARRELAQGWTTEDVEAQSGS